MLAATPVRLEAVTHLLPALRRALTLCCIVYFPVDLRRTPLAAIEIPADLDAVLDAAWAAACKVPGYLMEDEARLLGTIAACVPASGTIVEIGSFKGKSTVMLAKVAEHYGLGSIVAIDPHNSPELLDRQADPAASSYKDFLRNIEAAGIASQVEPHRAYSKDVSAGWNQPIRFLWIDGDHTYQGAKTDFDGFFPHVSPNGVVAIHDTLNVFSGPIRVFVEDILRSNQFGAAGFCHSIAWSQFRPQDGSQFQKQRARLERVAAPLIPFVKDDKELHGLTKLLYKLTRSRVPRSAISPAKWVSMLNSPNEG
jgi:predicted O-methyltransferase YrrM